MKTSKPISSISFNSKKHLIAVLRNLQENNIISFFACIKHLGEKNDETGTGKNHYHLYVEPNKLIDTELIRKQFIEPVKNDKPLGCLPFQSSKHFADWYLYILHDPIYLATKQQRREFSYCKDDIITSDKAYLNVKVADIKPADQNTYIEIKQFIEKGLNFTQYCIMKNLNPMKIKAHENAWQMVQFLMIDTDKVKETEDELKEMAELDAVPIPQISKKT